MKKVKALLTSVDNIQRRAKILAIAFAVIKKYSDDNCSSFATQLAYNGFFALFPLYLAVFALLSISLSQVASPAETVAKHGLSQLPIIGPELANNSRVKDFARKGPLALIAACLVLMWGSRGVAQAAQFAIASAWNVPMVTRPGLVKRTLKGFVLLGVLILGAAASGIPSLVAGYLHRLGGFSVVITYLIGLGLDFALYLTGFRLLSPKEASYKQLIPGALLGAFLWSALQNLGGYLVRRYLTHASPVYGSFGLVIGLITWLTLVASAALYAAELNVVLARRLWPRALLTEDLTPADLKVFSALAETQQHHKDQQIAVSFSKAGRSDARSP